VGEIAGILRGDGQRADYVNYQCQRGLYYIVSSTHLFVSGMLELLCMSGLVSTCKVTIFKRNNEIVFSASCQWCYNKISAAGAALIYVACIA
jgi:hypothetical protein